MPVAVPLAIVGSSLIGGAISSNASNRAAQQQQAGTDAAVAEQRRQFDQMMQLMMPSYNRTNYAADIYMRALGIPMPQGYGQQQGGGIQPGGTNTGSGQYGSTGGYNTGGGGIVQQLGGQVAGINPRGLPTGLGSDTATIGAGTGEPLINGGPNGTGGGGTGGDMTGGDVTGGYDIGTQQGIYDMVRGTPGYQAQLQQGMTAIDRASPLRGGMYSGRRMQALNDYGQNTFGSYYGDWMNRVGGMAGQAPSIGQSIGQAGMGMANNVGNLMTQGANARAQGTINSANAWSGAIGQGVGMVGGMQGWW